MTNHRNLRGAPFDIPAIAGVVGAGMALVALFLSLLATHNSNNAKANADNGKKSAQATISAQAPLVTKGVDLAKQLNALCKGADFRAEHRSFCIQASSLATATVIPGPAGPSGSVGAKGSSGASGLPGAAGRAGSTGPPGPQGKKGETGPSGPIGASGSNGANGTNGTSGTDGSKGDPGVKGDQGVAGPAGTDPSNIDFTFTVPGNPPLRSDTTYDVHCPWNAEAKKYDTCIVTPQ